MAADRLCALAFVIKYAHAYILLVDDSLVPGYRCKMPLLIVLDSLKSEDMHVRRVGETWMRCSLKSYIR